MYIREGGYPMYIREGVPDVHQGGEYPMYIREGVPDVHKGGVPDVRVPDVHINWPVCDIPVICYRFSDL